MGGLQIALEVTLIAMLAGALLHGWRLRRGAGGIGRDRAALEELLQSFDESNRQAEAGAERLRIAADSAQRAMARQVDGASNLREELIELIERGERLTGRLATVARTEREIAPPRRPAPEPELAEAGAPRVPSQAERDLLRALRVTR